MAEQSVDSPFKKLKEFYDTYKILIWVLSLFSGTAAYDRFYNMWDMPNKVESYKEEFINTRKGDSMRFSDFVYEQSLINAQLMDEIHSLKDSLSKSNIN